jgi:carboxypeptidase family protein
MGGLSGMAREAGFSWCERCKLFAVNDKNFPRYFSSTADMEALCSQSPIRDWLGPKPTGHVSCDTVGIAGQVHKNNVPMAGIPVTLTVDGVSVVMTTDGAGAFRFDRLDPKKTYQLEATAQLGGFEYRAFKSVRAIAGVLQTVELELVAVVGARRARIGGIAFLANQGDAAYATVGFEEDVVLDPQSPMGHISVRPCGNSPYGGPGVKIEADVRLLPDQSIEFNGKFDLITYGCETGVPFESTTYAVTVKPGENHYHFIQLGDFRAKLNLGFSNNAP